MFNGLIGPAIADLYSSNPIGITILLVVLLVLGLKIFR
jgi:hypothetical protein